MELHGGKIPRVPIRSVVVVGRSSLAFRRPLADPVVCSTTSGVQMCSFFSAVSHISVDKWINSCPDCRGEQAQATPRRVGRHGNVHRRIGLHCAGSSSMCRRKPRQGNGRNHFPGNLTLCASGRPRTVWGSIPTRANPCVAGSRPRRAKTSPTPKPRVAAQKKKGKTP